MKARKGTYKICTDKGWKEYTGSYCIHFPFIIHRRQGEKWWKVSHLATGYNVRGNLTKFKQCKQMVSELAVFPIFLMPTMETWTKALNRMEKRKPEEHSKLLSIVRKEYE